MEKMKAAGEAYNERYAPHRPPAMVGSGATGQRSGWKRIYRGEELAGGRFGLKKASKPVEQGDVGALFEPAGTIFPYSHDTRASKEMPYRRIVLKKGKLRSAAYGISKAILASPDFIQIADNIYLQEVKPKYKEKGYIALVPARRVLGEERKVAAPVHLTHYAPLQASGLLNKGHRKLVLFVPGKTNIEIGGPEGEIYRQALRNGALPDSWMAMALKEMSPVGKYGKEKAIIRDEIIEDIAPYIRKMLNRMPPGSVSVEKIARRLEEEPKRFVLTAKSLEPLSKDKRIELKDAVTEALFDLAQKGVLTYKVSKKGDRVVFRKP